MSERTSNRWRTTSRAEFAGSWLLPIHRGVSVFSGLANYSWWTPLVSNPQHPWVSGKLEVAFGQAVRDRRLAAGLTQEGLAEIAQLTRNYVSELERGLKSPTLASVASLAAALDVRPHVLIKAAEDRS
jgi:DNA-binding XRE family transcriptional regulator